MRASETRGLTPVQRARLAYAVSIIRDDTRTLRGWTQEREPLRLLKRDRRGRLAQVYVVGDG